MTVHNSWWATNMEVTHILTCLYLMTYIIIIIIIIILVLRIELRILCLPGRCRATGLYCQLYCFAYALRIVINWNDFFVPDKVIHCIFWSSVININCYFFWGARRNPSMNSQRNNKMKEQYRKGPVVGNTHRFTGLTESQTLDPREMSFQIGSTIIPAL